MISRSEADLFLRPMDFYVRQEFVGFSNVVSSVSYFPLQIIETKMNERNFKNLTSFLSFFVPSFSYALLVSTGILIHYLIFLKFFSYIKRLPHSTAAKKQNLQIKIITFSFLIFAFLTGMFFSNSLNALKIIVDTRDLLSCKEKVLQTKKEVCFFEKSSELDFFSQVSFWIEMFVLVNQLIFFPCLNLGTQEYTCI